MSCGQSSPEVQVHLVAVSTTDAFHWFTGWMPSIGLDNVKAALKAHAVSGTTRCSPARAGWRRAT